MQIITLLSIFVIIGLRKPKLIGFALEDVFVHASIFRSYIPFQQSHNFKASRFQSGFHSEAVTQYWNSPPEVLVAKQLY